MGLTSVESPGGILLVSCYELGHQPLGLALPKAFLERAGYRPAVLDLSLEPLDERRVRRARLVAVSVPMHTALRIGLHAAARIRELNPEATICFFGLYALLNSEYVLSRFADCVLGGECEESLVRLAASMREGHACAFTSIERCGSSLGELRRLDFPVPSRDGLVPLQSYARFAAGDREEVVGYVEASRGCRHFCAHCPIPPVYGGRFFVIPAEVVMEDIRRLFSAGARHITFGDPDFLNGPRHSLRIVGELHREFPDVTYDFTAKIEHLKNRAALLARFAETGCSFIVTAAESLSDSVLERLQKGHSRADVLTALRLVRGAGIAFRPTWVPFTPWSSLEDYIEILEFVEEEDLIGAVDLVQYALRLLIPPGSLLLSEPSIAPHLRELVGDGLSYRWVHPDPRMDRLHGEVAALVERSTVGRRDPFTPFFEIKERAFAAAGRAWTGPFPGRAERWIHRPPRLTEPWFC